MKKEKVYEPDKVVGEIEVKGKKYVVKEGAKGGRYYINSKGKKTYVKEKTESKPKPKIVEKTIYVNKEKTYICYYNRLDPETGECIDDFKEWCKASSLASAREEFEDRYHRSLANGTIEIFDIVEEL